LETEHGVQLIDDLSTGSILNIEHLKSNPNLTYVMDTAMNRHLQEIPCHRLLRKAPLKHLVTR
jgi:hypothetical protein